jgi:SnoaL-like domain
MASSHDDWHEVFDLSLRYAEGIDRRDWDAFAACFTPTVQVDFSSFSHRPAPSEPLSRDAWVAAVRSTIDGFPSTQHLIGNQRIRFDGPDRGAYTAYIQAQHWADRDRWYLIGGWYENRVERHDGAWKLAAVTLHQTWDAGERGLLRELNQGR